MQGVPRPSPTDLPGVTSLFFFARAHDGVATRRRARQPRRGELIKSLGKDRFYVAERRRDRRPYGSIELCLGLQLPTSRRIERTHRCDAPT